MKTLTLTIKLTGARRTYRTLGEMILSFGVPARSVQLERSTARGYYVYINGGLVGEAVRA